jgi:hypothetical protein
MADAEQGMVAFLGIAPSPRLLDQDKSNLPDAEQRREVTISTHEHDRLVAAGSVLTGVTLVAGIALALYGGWQLLFEGGGALNGVLLAIGLLLAGTHWGWVHVAEYAGLTIDDRRQRSADAAGTHWLAGIEPYARFSVRTTALDDGSIRIERLRHRPVLTPERTFTFVREVDGEETYGADTRAEVVADAVETMRRDARLSTDRLREFWEVAAEAYADAQLREGDDQQQLAAHRAASAALSEHINASLREPPLVE